MKNLIEFLLLFFRIRKIRLTRTMQELFSVAKELDWRHNVYFWGNERFSREIARQAISLHIYLEELEEFSAYIKYADIYLVEGLMDARNTQVKDLPYLLSICRSYDNHTAKRLSDFMSSVISRGVSSLDNLLTIIKSFNHYGDSGHGKIKVDLFSNNTLDKLADDLTLLVSPMNYEEVEKCKKDILSNAPERVRQRFVLALVEHKKISSAEAALNLLRFLQNSSRAVRSAVFNETISLVEEEVKSKEDAMRLLKLFSEEKNACLFAKEDFDKLKNGIVEKAISLESDSGYTPFYILVFFASMMECDNKPLLGKVFGAAIKTMRAEKTGANDAVFMAAQFKTGEARHLFLHLYVEEIWKPSFNEAFILLSSYRKEKVFPKDDMDNAIFSKLKKENIEFGAEELARIQVWVSGGGNSTNMPQALKNEMKNFLNEVIKQALIA